MKTLSNTNDTLSEILMEMTENASLIPEFIGEALFFIDPNLNILYFNSAAFNLVSEVCSSECKIGNQIIEYFLV